MVFGYRDQPENEVAERNGLVLTVMEGHGHTLRMSSVSALDQLQVSLRARRFDLEQWAREVELGRRAAGQRRLYFSVERSQLQPIRG